MKFKDFLAEHRQYKLSEQEKFFVYDKIFRPSTCKVGKNQRYSFKQLSYIAILSFLLVGIFGTYFLIPEYHSDNSFFHIDNRDTSTTVSAGFIAKVMEFTGDFHIQQSGKTIQTSSIKNNDLVILNPGTTLTVNVVDGSTIEMIGPARFSIEKKDNSPYILRIEEGTFTRIKNKSKDQNMEVVVDDAMTIKTAKEDTHFSITKKGKKYFIDNSGESISIQTSQQKQEKKIENNKILTLNTQTNIFDIKDREKVMVALNNEKIKQSFELNISEEMNKLTHPKPMINEQKTLVTSNTGINNNSSESSSGNIVSTGVKDESLLSDINISHIEKVVADTDIADNTTIQGLTSSKAIFTDEQYTVLRTTLNNFFGGNYIRDIENTFETKDTGEINIGHLIDKQVKLIEILDPTKTGAKTKTLDSIINNYITIKQILSDKYYTPTEYKENIDLFINRIKKLM